MVRDGTRPVAGGDGRFGQLDLIGEPLRLMLFTTYQFLIGFLPAALAGFFALRAFGLHKASITFLLICSLAFYAIGSLVHLGLLAGSIGVNYFLGRTIAQERPYRRLLLIGGVGFNLALIFWFKYLDFTLENLAPLTGTTHTLRNIILPLGISFFTFQQIGYLVDCYTDKIPEQNFRQYALFVSFFPQLIAGPIVHHSHTRPQFAALARPGFDLNALSYGVMIFALGLGKKALVADPIARAIDPIYTMAASGEPLTVALSIAAILGYTLQIYFDFSGYCDMAIGLGLMFGIRLPINFNSPYKSASIIEFWKRWHITLSKFLRDYVYIPLGGNRAGEVMRLRNIFLTMLIGGVWHGAAWTFIIWGALHATAITANHATRMVWPGLDRINSAGPKLLKRAALLAFIMGSWVYFRSPSVDAAHTVFAGLLGTGLGDISLSSPPALTDYTVPVQIYLFMGFASLIALFAPNSLEITGYKENWKEPLPNLSGPAPRMELTPSAALTTAILFTGGLAVAWQPSIFIYFNF